MRYEFEVLECGINPPSLRPAIYDTPLESGHCFYIVSSGENGVGSTLALEVSKKSPYDPSWGIFNIDVQNYPGKKSDFKPQ